MTITQPCKVCKRELALEADEQCEPHWLKVFLAMVVCNRCFDLREERNDITRKIYALCQYLRALDGFKLKDEDKRRKRSQVRDRLTVRTKEYARWFRKVLNGHTEVWSDEFVDLLMDKPDQADVLLKMYRDGARAEVTASPPITRFENATAIGNYE